MAFHQLEYFKIDKLSAPISPASQPGYTQPFFGGRILQDVTMRDQDNQEIVVSEREEFANILKNETAFKGNKAFAPGVCLQMFGVSAEEWDPVSGQLRNIIYHANSRTMPKLLKGEEKLYDLGPRTPNARSALKGTIIPTLTQQFSFLQPSSVTNEQIFKTWFDRLWEILFAAESKLLNDRHDDIQQRLFGRPDQIFKFDWAHADIGAISMNTVKGTSGAVIGFEKASAKPTLTLPSYLPRPPLEDLSVRIVIEVATSELAPIQGEADHGLSRSPLPRSVHISMAELNALRFDDVEADDCLTQLTRALEHDLDIHFWRDRLILAWRNLHGFWGTENLVRIRTSTELVAVLKGLRDCHPLRQGDQMLFLSLVSIDNTELMLPRQHPPWPKEYEVVIAPQSREKSSPKRARDPSTPTEADTPRKRRGRSSGP